MGFGSGAGETALVGDGEVTFVQTVNEWDEETGDADPDGNAEEAYSRKALVEPIDVGEYERVTVQKGEKNDVYDCEIERDQNNDRFSNGQDKRTGKRMGEHGRK